MEDTANRRDHGPNRILETKYRERADKSVGISDFGDSRFLNVNRVAVQPVTARPITCICLCERQLKAAYRTTDVLRVLDQKWWRFHVLFMLLVTWLV